MASLADVAAFAAIASPAALVVAGYPKKTIYFYWHPALCVTAVATFLTSVRLLRTRKAGSKGGVAKIHQFANACGLITLLSGIYVIYDVKNINKKKHLQTPHSWIGATVVALATITSTAALATVFTEEDRAAVSRKVAPHRKIGRIAVALFGVAVATGIAQSFAADKMPGLRYAGLTGTGLAVAAALGFGFA